MVIELWNVQECLRMDRWTDSAMPYASVFSKRAYNKRPQAMCPLTFEMSVCGEYVYNIYVLNNVLIFYNPLNRLIFNFPICCKAQLTEKSDLQNCK